MRLRPRRPGTPSKRSLRHSDVGPVGIVPVLEVAVNHLGSGTALEADAASPASARMTASSDQDDRRSRSFQSIR